MFRSKKFRIVLVISALILMAAVMASHEDQSVPDPIYEGKHLSEWLKQFDKGDFTSISHLQFPQLDSNAVPLITQTLEFRHDFLSRSYFNLYAQAPGLFRWLPKPSEYLICLNLTAFLAEQKDISEYTIPLLIKQLKTSDVDFLRIQAAISLWEMGADDSNTLAAFKSAQSDESPILRRAATNILRNIAAKKIMETYWSAVTTKP